MTAPALLQLAQNGADSFQTQEVGVNRGWMGDWMSGSSGIAVRRGGRAGAGAVFDVQRATAGRGSGGLCEYHADRSGRQSLDPSVTEWR